MSTQKIAIVGGGLAGLYAAFRLHQAGIAFDLFEARSRLGGRILSTASGSFDLGPTWFWPDFQPRIQALLAGLDIATFEQYETGETLVERWPIGVMRRVGYRSGNLAMRIEGGSARLTDALAALLPPGQLHLDSELTAARLDGERVQLALLQPRRHTLEANYSQLWLAVPPRVLSRIVFNPDLRESERQRLAAVPTWMAAHAKYVARYARPFWRDQGLAGNAFSSIGPLGEIHDACNTEGAALFGFFAIGAMHRRTLADAELKARCRAQLTHLFGEQATTPIEDFIQDWAAEPFTATEADQAPPGWHGMHDLGNVFESVWKDRIRLIGSEAGGDQAGYMEGAILAVEKVLKRLA